VCAPAGGATGRGGRFIRCFLSRMDAHSRQKARISAMFIGSNAVVARSMTTRTLFLRKVLAISSSVCKVALFPQIRGVSVYSMACLAATKIGDLARIV
jgi:hypothetical protein